MRLVQIDTPAVYFGVEGYGWQASATTKRLLPPGARVWLLPEPATDRVDQYGRLLRYVIRTRNAGFTACAPHPLRPLRSKGGLRADELVQPDIVEIVGHGRIVPHPNLGRAASRARMADARGLV